MFSGLFRYKIIRVWVVCFSWNLWVLALGLRQHVH